MVDNKLKISYDRAIALLGKKDYEGLICIKIVSENGGCQCLAHCYPKT